MSDPTRVPTAQPPVLLRLENFSFNYRGTEAPALEAVDLTLRPGEALAVLGPQGAGTSTMARAAAGLLGDHGHSSGVRELRDTDQSKEAQDHAPPRPSGGVHTGTDQGGVAMLGDDPEAQLTGLTGTVRDEAALPGRLIGLPLPECLQRAEASLQALGIGGLAKQALATLSGGQRQLTALAGLLTLRPSVLVLDQPSQALDAGARRRLARSLREFRDAGGAVLLTGHQHDDLTAACDDVLFLDQGRPVRTPPEGLGPAAPTQMEPSQTEPAQSQPSQSRPSPTQLNQTRLTEAQLDRHGIWDARRTPAASEAAGEETPRRGREPLLRVRELSVRRDATHVLERIELDLFGGEVTALLGANGSGKSTLLGALAGLLPAEPGAGITGPGGVELAAMPAHRRAEHLGWVGQDPGEQLSASTVRAELLGAVPLRPGGARLRREDRRRARVQRQLAVQHVMEAAGLSAAGDQHPYDLVPAQRKDCVIASALLLEPAVLLLDEPTLGRDAAGMHRLSSLVRGFTAAGGAVLVATHDQRWAAEIGDHQLRLGQRT